MNRWKGDVSMEGGNYVGFKNAQYDKHVNAAAATTDPAKRIDEIKMAEEIFSEEAPFWFFNYNKAIMAHQPWVHGLAKVAPEMMFQDLVNVWVDEKIAPGQSKVDRLILKPAGGAYYAPPRITFNIQPSGL